MHSVHHDELAGLEEQHDQAHTYLEDAPKALGGYLARQGWGSRRGWPRPQPGCAPKAWQEEASLLQVERAPRGELNTRRQDVALSKAWEALALHGAHLTLQRLTNARALAHSF